jgi:hypothetical protein
MTDTASQRDVTSRVSDEGFDLEREGMRASWKPRVPGGRSRGVSGLDELEEGRCVKGCSEFARRRRRVR